MTTQQIHYFITLAASLNYTNAASELQISVSTLSRQIVLMENELNVQLLKRDNRNVRLTSCGKFFLEEIRPLYQNYQMVADSTRKIYQGFSGNISIGILPDITLNGPLQEHFARFRKEHPDTILQMERASYKQLTEGLQTGSYDCIICFFFAIDNLISLNYKIVENIEEGILVSRKNPLSKKKFFDPIDFKNQTFILLSPDDNDYVSTGPISFFKEHGFYPNLTYAPDLDTATLMVEAGEGVCFSYAKSIGSYNPSMKFLPLKEGLVMTRSPRLVLAWNDNLTNPVAKVFIDSFES